MLYWIVGLNVLCIFFHDMVDHIYLKHILRPWNQWKYLVTSATSRLKFAHERCVMSLEREGTLAWTKTESSPKSSHGKTYRPAQERIYHNCGVWSTIVSQGISLVASYYNHYNRDQSWLLSLRGETTPLGVWHQQYTHNHDWPLISPKYCIYASVYRVSIDSDNGLSPFRRQAII